MYIALPLDTVIAAEAEEKLHSYPFHNAALIKGGIQMLKIGSLK